MMGEMAWPPPRGNRPSSQSSPSPSHGGRAEPGLPGALKPARISGSRKQSTAKSLLPGIRHQPPPLQKGPSGGRRCCCSTALRGPRSRLLPDTAGNGWATWPSATDPKSRHHHGGEGPLMSGAASLGLAP